MLRCCYCRKAFCLSRPIVSLLLLQTLLHVFRVALGYALMLVVMTFNASIYIAVLVGAAIGHLTAAWTHLRWDSLTAERAPPNDGCSGGAVTPGTSEPRPLMMNYQTCHWQESVTPWHWINMWALLWYISSNACVNVTFFNCTTIISVDELSPPVAL